jgi:hypothetical protein
VHQVTPFDWGEHPIARFRPWPHSIPVFMFTHKLTKTVFGKADRSGFYYFVIPVCRRNRTPEAGFDVLGTITVVSLSVGVVLLMRLILTN